MIDYDVLIAGGGSAGLALACALGRTLGSDAKVGVLAGGSGSPDDPRAYALSAGSRNLLAEIGAWQGLGDVCQPVSGIDITDSSVDDAMRPILLSYDTQLVEGEPAMWIVPAGPLADTIAAAVRAVPDVEVIQKARATSLSYGPGLAIVGLTDGTQRRARLVVAADGRRSVLREAAGIGSLKWSYRQTGIVTTVAHERPHRGRAVQHFLPSGPFAILPLTGDRSCITWTESEDTARRILAMDDAAFLGEVSRRFGHRLGELKLAGGRAGWPLTFDLARDLTATRLALVGDAARGVHPIAGQGLNLGLRDVAALAESIVDGMRLGLDPGDGTILDRYAMWRRFDGLTATAAFTALNTLFSTDGALTRAVRDVGLGVVDRLDGLKRSIVDEAAGMTGDVPRLLRGEPL